MGVVGGWSVGSGGSCGAVGTLPLKWDSTRLRGSLILSAAPWCCWSSRYFSVSRLCERMWRVSLLWCGNVVPQYIQGYSLGEPAVSAHSSSCNQTSNTSTSCCVPARERRIPKPLYKKLTLICLAGGKGCGSLFPHLCIATHPRTDRWFKGKLKTS